jgi:hypothetical protein
MELRGQLFRAWFVLFAREDGPKQMGMEQGNTAGEGVHRAAVLRALCPTAWRRATLLFTVDSPRSQSHSGFSLFTEEINFFRTLLTHVHSHIPSPLSPTSLQPVSPPPSPPFPQAGFSVGARDSFLASIADAIGFNASLPAHRRVLFLGQGGKGMWGGYMGVLHR